MSTPSESSKASKSPRGKSEEKGADREKSRSPLQRRPFGTKQRKKAAKGEFGKVKFADPIDDRDKSEEKKKDGGKEEGRSRETGKGSSKDKPKGKGKQKGKQKGKHKGKSKQKGKAKGEGKQKEEKKAAPAGEAGGKR